jgi:hypothetical protein
MRGRSRLAPVVAGLLVAAYVAAFRRFGIYDLADEGLLLAQAARAAAGERPYLDFHTGYGPVYFALEAALVRAGGLAAIRAALAVVHGVTAAFLFSVTRALAGPALAAAAVAVEVAFFLPLAPATGAPFNVPYPAWYAALGGVVITALMARGARRPAALAMAGAVAGAVFAMKPNSGALLAAGAAAASAMAGPSPNRGRLVAAAVVALALVVVVLLVAPTGVSGIALVLVAPVAVLAWRGRSLLARNGAAVPRLAALAAGFLAVAAPALGPTLAGLGPTRFAHEVLNLGTGVADLYLVPIGWAAVAATLLGLATLAAGTPRAGVAAGLVLLAAVFAGGASGAPSAAEGARLGAERAALAAVPLALLGGIALVAHDARIVPVLAVAVLAAPQLYPRPDFDHLMSLAPLVLPIAVLVGRAALVRLGVPPGRATTAAVAVALLLAAGRFLPSGRALMTVVGGRAATVEVPMGALVALPQGLDRLQAIAAAATAVSASTAPEERVLAFPACAAVPFLARRLPAGPHDYFYPGRPTREEVAALAQRLRAAPPPMAVTCSAPGRLADAWESYPELVALLGERYRLVLERPPVSVRRRID